MRKVIKIEWFTLSAQLALSLLYKLHRNYVQFANFAFLFVTDRRSKKNVSRDASLTTAALEMLTRYSPRVRWTPVISPARKMQALALKTCIACIILVLSTHQTAAEQGKTRFYVSVNYTIKDAKEWQIAHLVANDVD
jgi:hypothetical protein